MRSEEAKQTKRRVIGRLLVLAGIFKTVVSETVEVCNSEEHTVSCPTNHIILIKSAEFGRMTIGRCITEEDEFLGCSNDVLPLLDRWCSGRQRCDIKVSNNDLEIANTNCLKILKLFLKFDYSCLQANTKCHSSTPNRLSRNKGHISSLTTDSGECTFIGSMWIINVDAGRIINLDIVDFRSGQEISNLISCPYVYGFILEKPLGINHTICGGLQRERSLYTSKTNSIEVHLLPRKKRNNGMFLIKYTVTGCPEISPNANSWYKREGNEAVIGCENNDKEWRLTCIGNKWTGEIGNCSEIVSVAKPEITESSSFNFSTVVVISGIAGVAVVLSVIAVVSGVVYINKYRMKQEIKRVQTYKTYSTLGRGQQIYYRPATFDQSVNSDANWDVTLPLEQQQMIIATEKCTCPTLQSCCPSDIKKGTGKCPEERQSLYSSIKST